MLVLVVPVIDIAQVKQDILENHHLVDGFELRWDYCADINEDMIAEIRQMTAKPLLFTLRKKEQGGLFQGNENERWALMQNLAKYLPDYMDLEWDVPLEWFLQLKCAFPSIKLIASYHHFSSDGLDIQKIYQKVRAYPITIFKCACEVQSSLHALELYVTTSRLIDIPFTIIAMGECGQFLRVLGPVLNNAMDYVCVNNAVAPGQLTVKEILETYYYRTLNSKTRIYALLGNPVDKSLGHIWHNQHIHLHGINAVYVKIKLLAHELKAFLRLAFELPFDGFSVTMPVKKEIVQYVLASPHQVVNTLKRCEKGWLAHETDGEGASRALNLNKMCRILVIGDGGAATSIQKALLAHGHQVMSCSRKGEWQNKLNADVDCVINTIPAQVYWSGDKFTESILSILSEKHIVMDINYNQNSRFQQMALQVGATVIDGYSMFIEQAILQFKYWF